MHNLLLAFLLLLVAAVWGWTFVVVRDAIAVYGIVSFLAVRFTIGGTLIGGVSTWKATKNLIGGVSAWKATKKTFLVGGSIGVVLASAYLFQTIGLRYTTPTNCGLITGLFVVFAPLANRLLFGVRTGRGFWAAIGISLVGLALLTGTGSTSLALGDFLTLGAAACFGVHIALLDRHAKHHDATLLAWAQLTSAALLFWLMWPLTLPMVWPTRSVWIALIITGALATAAGFLIQTFVQQRLPAVRTAIIISMEPVFAALFGYILAGDRLSGIQITGAVLMIGAVLLAEVRGETLQTLIPKE